MVIIARALVPCTLFRCYDSQRVTRVAQGRVWTSALGYLPLG